MAENTIIITGTLASQPETKDNGRGPWVRARLAHPQGHYDKQTRQWVPADTPTAWFSVSASGRIGDNLATMNKGDRVLVVGGFSVDEWEPQSGDRAAFYKRTDLRIRADSVALVSRKQAQAAGQPPAVAGYAPAPATAASSQPGPAMPAAEPWENYAEPEF